MGFFDRIGENISNAPPEAWFTLAQALAANPNVGQGLAQGLAGFGGVIQDSKKKRGLATALGGMASSLPDNQRPIFEALTQYAPETLLQGYASQMFGNKGEQWQDVDLDKDGRIDFQLNTQTNERRASPLNYNDRIMTALGAANIPGVGIFDKFGNTLPGGVAQQPTQQPQPAQQQSDANGPPAPTVPLPNLGQLDQPATDAELAGQAPQPQAQTQPQPQTQTVPIPIPQLGFFGIKDTPEGKQWVRDFDKTTNTWSKPKLAEIPGASKQPNEAQLKSAQYLAEGTFAAEKLNNPAFVKDYIDWVNATKRTSDASEFLQSPKSQVYDTAAKSWLGVFLYQKSGAQITPQEFERSKGTYIPQAGDTPDRIAFKAQMRAIAERAVEMGLTPDQRKGVKDMVKTMTDEFNKKQNKPADPLGILQ